VPNVGYMAVQSVHLMALCLWIGGTVSLGMLAAPTVFRLSPSRAVAGHVMGEVFRRFDRIKEACCLALAVTSVLKFINWERNWNVWFGARYLAILVMISTALIGGWVITPAIGRLRTSSATGNDLHPPQAEQFRRLHGASVLLTRTGLFASLVALILS
jgi:uncharacterized membrane protein